MQRVVGGYKGEEHGPLLICLGGIHGNEPAGVEAVSTILELLKNAKTVNPEFKFKGCLLGLIGNIAANKYGVRYIDQDLNRLWDVNYIKTIFQKQELHSEDKELLDTLKTIHQYIDDYKPNHIIVMDVHTTSAAGGIFTIVSNDDEAIETAKSINAPVVKGLIHEIGGTTLHYFNNKNFKIPIKAISFEAGQHEDPLSKSRAIAAIVSCMRHEGMVAPQDVESKHDEILATYAAGLPELVHVIYKKSILPDENFKMRAGFNNFQKVQKGEHLADNINGKILSPYDGMILMPLYQKQGSDGFFIVN
jgi:succinylglutamate desuccinylase